MNEFKAIEQALQDLRDGKIILVVDDPDRENEGDFICAAEFATTENINFMATHGKGLICMPMAEEFVRKLQIPQMVRTNMRLLSQSPLTMPRRLPVFPPRSVP